MKTAKVLKLYALIVLDLIVIIVPFGIIVPPLISASWTLGVIVGFSLIGVMLPIIYIITMKIIRSFHEKN